MTYSHGRGARDLRLHRGLLQPQKASLDDRSGEPVSLRGEILEHGQCRSAVKCPLKRGNSRGTPLQAWTNGLNCPFAAQVFDVDGVPGSIGFKVRWSDGFTNDQVSFVRGNRRYVVVAGNGTNLPPAREVIVDATRQVADGLS